MKRLISFLTLLACLLTFTLTAPAEDSASYVGVWIETEGEGTLTIRLDGTATMAYSYGAVSEFQWEKTADGARFTEGMWYHSPMALLDENTLSVSGGWMIFAREGFLPTTDPALLLGAVPVGEEGEPYLGSWALTSVLMEGEAYDPALFGMAMTFTFNADGTMTSDDGFEEPYTTTWSVSYGYAVVEGDILSINEDGLLVYETPDGTMLFSFIEEETEEEPVDIPDLTPVGAEGDAFLGLWTLDAIVMDGESISPALFGISMTFDFRADGTVVSDDGEEPSVTAWHVENGAAIADGLALTIREDGKLVMEEDGAAMVFVKGEGTSSDELSEEEQWLLLLELMSEADDSATELPESMQPFVGEWQLCYVATGSLTGDLRTLGVTGYLTLDADSTGYLIGLTDEFGDWYDDEGVIRFGESGMPMFLIGDEEAETGLFLQYGTEAGGYMIFHQDPEATWVPGLYPLAIPAPDAAAAEGAALLMETRYVCKTYTAAGFTLDAATLGAEYAAVFHADGTVDFTLAGIAVPGLHWSTADGVIAIDYYGNPLPCTPTDAGFDMDYFSSMMMHFVPAE